MTDPGSIRADVDRFILNEIESVPHLEALLLLWNSRPQRWALAEMAKALYLSPEQTVPILHDLAQRKLILIDGDHHCYNQGHPKSDVIGWLDQLYRHEVVRISTLIHTKPSASVRAFARAFKWTKD
jgi:hypothetical protein